MDKSLSVCLVSSQYLPHVGGVENYVYHIALELAASGHSVMIVTSSFEGAPDHEFDDGIEIFRLPSIPFMNGRFPVLKYGRKLREFTRMMKARHFDLIAVNMRFYFISLYAVRLAKKMNTRCVVIDHGSSHLNTGGRLTTKLGELYEHIITFAEKRYCKEFAAVSRASLEWVRHFNIHSQTVFYNAVDPAELIRMSEQPVKDYRRIYDIPEQDTVISFVGRLTVEKGIRELTNVVRRINESDKNVWLLAAGDGYLLDELEQIKSENTFFVGQIPSDEVAALLTASDIFCLPSVSEGFPTCVLESAVCGCYVVTTYRGGAKELITDESFGVILPDNNEDGLYDALVRATAQPEACRAAAHKCRERVIGNYTWRHTAQALVEYITQRTD